MKLTCKKLKMFRDVIEDIREKGLIEYYSTTSYHDRYKDFFKVKGSPFIFSLPKTDYHMRYYKEDIHSIDEYYTTYVGFWGINHGTKFNTSPRKLYPLGISLKDVLESDMVPDEFKEEILFHLDLFLET